MTRIVYLLLSVILVAGICNDVCRAETESEEPSLLVEARVDYVSRYIWRGLDLFADDDAGINPQLFIDFYETGFYAGIWSMIPFDDDQRKFQEFDWYGGYYGSVLTGSDTQIDYDISYIYYDFPLDSKAVDFQEVYLKLNMPSLFSVGSISIVPYTTTVYTWPVTSKGFSDGWWFGAGLSSEIGVPKSLALSDGQVFSIYAETYYTDSGAQFDIDPGFTHLESGISTAIDFAGCTLSPSVHYSWTWEDSVNDENEFWYTLSASYAF